MARQLRIPILVGLLLGIASAFPHAELRAVERPMPRLSRVVLISVDGLRPDLILRANAPAMRGLMDRGSYSLWAHTTDVAVTLPSHTSMVTGVPPAKHGVDWNSDRPRNRDPYPKYPTLFEVARKAGYTTAMAAGKSKLQALAKPGTLTWSYVPSETVGLDSIVADTAVAWIGSFAPQVLFVHLPNVDTAGHREGWGSAAQVAAVGTADRCIGAIVNALRSRGILDSTLILVTADHGGAGKTHGPKDPRSLTIPWIVAGPGVCPGNDLTTDASLSIATEDTFATLCYVLGLTPPRPVDGKPVLEAFCAGSVRSR
jgi:type I phosphodiesterase/nucleotide pyrophosphatase